MIATALPCSALSEEKEKTVNANETSFIVMHGFMIVDAVIEYVLPYNDSSYLCYCEPVEKVTVIGFGVYANQNDSNWNVRFFMKSFTNVSYVMTFSYKKLEASDEYQHFSLFVTPRNMCALRLH